MRFLDMQSALDFVWANESLCPLEVLVDSGPLRTHDVISANRPSQSRPANAGCQLRQRNMGS